MGSEPSRTSLYESDILQWSEEQAAALRSLIGRSLALPDSLDLENVAEEIESVGRSELASVQSFVRLILVHVIKAASLPSASAVAHWRTDAVGFHNELIGRLTSSMLARVDLDALWQRATREAEAALAEHGQVLAAELPRQCPLALDALVDPDFDFLGLADAVRGQSGPPAPT